MPFRGPKESRWLGLLSGEKNARPRLGASIDWFVEQVARDPHEPTPGISQMAVAVMKAASAAA